MTLVRYLTSDLAPDACMTLSGLDGLLTAIVVGPEPVPCAEWLSTIWGQEQPEFASEQQRQDVLEAIIRRRDEIAACFDEHGGTIGPSFFDRAGGVMLAQGWVKGFFDGIALRRDAWQPLISHPQEKTLLALLLLLDEDSDFHREEDDPEVWDKILESAPDTILTCVSGIREFWRDRSNHENAPVLSRSWN